MSKPINPYQVLGVPDRSSIAVCRRAYRKLAKQWHPDVNNDPAAPAKLVLLNNCMDVLKDPQKKALLDNPPTQYIIRYTSQSTVSTATPITVVWYTT